MRGLPPRHHKSDISSNSPILRRYLFNYHLTEIQVKSSLISYLLLSILSAKNSFSKIYANNATNLPPRALLHDHLAPHRVRLLRMKTGPTRPINVRIPTGPGAPFPKEDSQVLNQFIIAVTKKLIFKQVVRVPPVGGSRGAYLRFTTPTKTGR